MKILKEFFAKPVEEISQQLPADLIREAKANPGGWVYEISSGYDPNGEVPPHAIKGAWQVSQAGEIIPGSYQPNPNSVRTSNALHMIDMVPATSSRAWSASRSCLIPVPGCVERWHERC